MSKINSLIPFITQSIIITFWTKATFEILNTEYITVCISPKVIKDLMSYSTITIDYEYPNTIILKSSTLAENFPSWNGIFHIHTSKRFTTK